MSKYRFSNLIPVLYSISIFSPYFCLPTSAQLVPDDSLGTRVERTENTTSILGGTERGANLFHSFFDFNVGSGKEVTFRSSPGIENIVTRVTGSDISNIDGTLRVMGRADFILLNPNGIIFGRGAKLDVNGSFVASTASSLDFGDNIFQVSDPTPLLSLNVPIGLGVLQGDGKIQIESGGASPRLTDFQFSDLLSSVPSIVNAGQSEVGIEVSEGQTISLIASQIKFDGGIVLAPSGQVNLFSVSEGYVSFKNGPSLNSILGDIVLKNQSLIDTSGPLDGGIRIRVNNFELLSGSHLLNQSLFGGGDRGIDIVANRRLFVSSVESSALEPVEFSMILERVSTISTVTFLGPAGFISIESPEVTLEDGGSITSFVFDKGDGGNIRVRTDKFTASGVSPDAPFVFSSGITAIASGTGRSPNISVEADVLEISSGGFIVTRTFGNGSAGSVNLFVHDFLKVEGSSLFIDGAPLASTIASTTGFLNSGDSGNVRVVAGELFILDGANINTNTSSTGNAGLVSIEAEKIFIAGDRSEISSGSFILSGFGFEGVLVGNAGTIDISAQELSVSAGGFISVSNFAVGQGGDISLNVELLSLDNGGVRADSNINTGGNIEINAAISILKNGGFITANSNSGDGGILDIDTLIVRDPTTEISAVSLQGGGDGIVMIEQSFDLNQALELPELPFLNSETFISDRCTPESKASSFVRSNSIHLDSPDLSLFFPAGTYDYKGYEAARELPKDPIVQMDGWAYNRRTGRVIEATGWQTDEHGNTIVGVSCSFQPDSL